MITIRSPDSLYQAYGEIGHGTFHGRWHFSFGEYHDPGHTGFGPLRVFNDDTLSPGAVWPLHYHEEIEVVTYCVGGVFRHADQRGEGGILKHRIVINGRKTVPAQGAVMATDEPELVMEAKGDSAELLLVDVPLA